MANGMACYHHPSQQAVAQCSVCGKGICKDCYDSYGAGMGVGKALCFDCTQDMVKEHTSDVAAFQKKVKSERKWMIIGAIVGLIFSVLNVKDMGPAVFLAIFIGASLGTIIKTIFSMGEFDPISLVVSAFLIVVSPIVTIYRFVKRINQIKEAEEVLASDARILQEMRDYFEYTQVMEKNEGVDLAKLASQGSELFDNTYAQAILNNGEEKAREQLRQGAVQIAANGEIIRGFDKKKGKKKDKAAA